MPNDGNTIVTAARFYLGVPWRHQGRTRAGLDCAGLAVRVAHDLDLFSYDTTDYRRRPDGYRFVAHFQAVMDPVPVADREIGDVLLFADQAYPCHAAIVSERRGVPHLIHAHALRRRVIEEPYTGEWPLKVKFAFRFRNLCRD